MSREDLLKRIRSFYLQKRKELGIVRLGVFGSAARNELSENSDIDIVVELEQPDLFALVALKQELEEQLQCPVDVVRYRQNMNKLLKERIEREAIYV